MKTYDFIFSLGFGCAVSQALRDLGLQRGSYPFDWIGTIGPLMAPRMMAADFKDWFNREDLKLWDVRFEGGHIARLYKNVKTGFGFAHDFSNAEELYTTYEAAREKYERRIARFKKVMAASKTVLAIYLTRPQDARPTDEELREARETIAKLYPAATIEILCFYEDESCTRAEEVSSTDGVSVVKAHYRQYKNGEIFHVVNREQLVAYLREHVTIVNPMTPEEMRAQEKEKKRAYLASLGTTRLSRRIHKKLLQWYRDLEVYLIGQKLMPDDHPTWFDGDGK